MTGLNYGDGDTELWCAKHAASRTICECPYGDPERPDISAHIKTVDSTLIQRIMSEPDPEWAVPGLVGEGLTLLAGGSKVGKSFMALDMALAISEGGPALNMSVPCEQGDVLLISAEDGERRIGVRAFENLGTHELSGRLSLVDRMPAGISAHALSRAWLDSPDRINPRLIVLDTLAKTTGGESSRRQGQSSYDFEYQKVHALHEFAMSNGISLLAITHTNQARLESGDDWASKITGTTGTLGGVDTFILIDSVRGTREGTLRVTGRDVPDNEYGLVRIGPFWQVTDTLPDDPRLGNQTNRILAFLRTAEGPCTAEQIEDSTGIPITTIRVYLGRMTKTGKVFRAARGQYQAMPSVGFVEEEPVNV